MKYSFVRAISRLVQHGSPLTILCSCSMIFGVVAVCDRSLRGLFSTLVRPRSNSETHIGTIGNE